MKDLVERYPRTTLYILCVLILFTLASRWKG